MSSATKTIDFERESEDTRQAKEEDGRFCKADNCSCGAVLSGYCLFHSAISPRFSQSVTRIVKEPLFRHNEHILSPQEASRENRLLLVNDLYKEVVRYRDRDYRTKDIAYRIYIHLWHEGYIPPEVDAEVRSADALYDALTVRKRIALESGQVFLTLWLCTVYENFLIRKVESIAKQREGVSDDE